MNGRSPVAGEVAERRRRRAAAQQTFDTIAAEYVDAPEVSRAVMFGSNGLRCRDSFFAFVGRDGDLIVKLPAGDASALVAEGQATAVRVGRHAAREWVGVPHPEDRGGIDRWRELMAAAHRYVSGLRPTSGRGIRPPVVVPATVHGARAAAMTI